MSASDQDEGSPGQPAIGTIAGGVAHEINDPLAVVRANLAYVIERLTDLSFEDRARLDDLVVALEEASRATSRMTQVVRELAAVGQVSEAPPGPVDLVASLEGALTTVENDLRRPLEVVRRLDPVPDVLGREPQLCRALVQVLAGLVQGEATPRELQVRTSSDGERVLLEIKVMGGHDGRPPRLAAALIDALGGRLEASTTEAGRAVRRVSFPAVQTARAARSAG